MFLSDVPPFCQLILYPSMNNSISAVVVASGSTLLGGVSPTCALGKRQADPSWGCRTSRSLRTGHGPSQLQLGKTRKVMTWVDAYGWESLCRNPAFQRRNNSIPMEKKKSMSLDPLETEEGTLPALPLFQGSTAQGWPSQRHPTPQGKDRVVRECPATQPCGTLADKPSLSRTLSMDVRTPWLREGR